MGASLSASLKRTRKSSYQLRAEASAPAIFRALAIAQCQEYFFNLAPVQRRPGVHSDPHREDSATFDNNVHRRSSVVTSCQTFWRSLEQLMSGERSRDVGKAFSLLYLSMGVSLAARCALTASSPRAGPRGLPMGRSGNTSTGSVLHGANRRHRWLSSKGCIT